MVRKLNGQPITMTEVEAIVIEKAEQAVKKQKLDEQADN